MPPKKMTPSKSSVKLVASKSAQKASKPPAKAVKVAAKASVSEKGAKPTASLGGTLKKMLGLKPAKDLKLSGKATLQPKGTLPKGAEKEASKATGKGKRLSLAAQVGVRSPAPVSGPAICREVACELTATTATYCRMHYIKNWKKIQRKQMILKERKLNSYIEELVSKYPDKYIEAIRQDLSSEKDFSKVIADLEIDEGIDDFELDDAEGAEGLIDNLKREFDDEGDVF
jgi:hypothetical protein